MYTKRLQFRLNIPTLVYSERAELSGMTVSLTKSQNGDLIYDRAQQLQSLNKEELYKKYDLLKETKYCLFFTGSRPKHFKYAFPFMNKVIDNLPQSFPMTPLLVLSPFINDSEKEKAFKKAKSANIPCLTGDSLELMSISHFLVTLPGTNTAEALYMNLPLPPRVL